MAKIRELDMENVDTLCDVGKALSSPVRVEILKLLYSDNMIIGEIAKGGTWMSMRSSVWKCPSAVIPVVKSIPPADCIPRRELSAWRIQNTAFTILRK